MADKEVVYLLTFQDFLIAKDKDRVPQFIRSLISEHTNSEMYLTALDANDYDHRQNVTIRKFIKTMFSSKGKPIEDITASNIKIASNFFGKLNTQRVSYLLGNGVTFTKDDTKKKLGQKFDTVIKKAARFALIHGVSYVFLNMDECRYFKLTEFAPLYDENTNILRAGVRFYQIDESKPMTVCMYEEDGYTVYRSIRGGKLEEIKPKRAYIQIVKTVPADEEPEVIGEENYSGLPIVPLWGSDLHQSTLIGMQEEIDSYDLIRSGFANDLNDCAEIYWLISGFMGMSETDIMKFRDRLKLQHIALADTDNGTVAPYTQNIPHEARTAFLNQIREQIYEDFGAFDVRNFGSGSKTATEIQAAYQPLDDEADDFEYQIIECIQQLLKLIGIDDTPVFKRNKITNQLEQVQLVMAEAEYLDDETVLNKLPNVTPDEVKEILARKDTEDADRMKIQEAELEKLREQQKNQQPQEEEEQQ